MKRKLIEIHQEFKIKCDNSDCDFTVKNETGDPYNDIEPYLNKPCPDCGENLLTDEDHKQANRVLSLITFINKYFSWLLFLTPKSNKSESIGTVHVHKGVKLGKKEKKQ